MEPISVFEMLLCRTSCKLLFKLVVGRTSWNTYIFIFITLVIYFVEDVLTYLKEIMSYWISCFFFNFPLLDTNIFFYLNTGWFTCGEVHFCSITCVLSPYFPSCVDRAFGQHRLPYLRRMGFWYLPMQVFWDSDSFLISYVVAWYVVWWYVVLIFKIIHNIIGNLFRFISIFARTHL